MIVGLLIMIIGIIPISLAFGARRIFENSELSKPILLHMTLTSLWQVDVGILYFNGIIPDEWILFLYRLFRLAPTYIITAVIYATYIIINKYAINFQKNSFLEKISKLFSRKIMIGIYIWITFIYLINWTSFGSKGLMEVQIFKTNLQYYFPVYGPLNWLYVLHICTYLFFTLILYMMASRIQNRYMMKFIKSFSLYSLFLLLFGLLNFIPSSGSIASSIGVVFFSVLTMFSFLKMNVQMTLKVNQLTGRQKKMDYTGNLAASLVHEVQNIGQIIKGFSQLLGESPSLGIKEKGMLEVIKKATVQMEDLSENYKKFIESSKIDFKLEDLNEIITETIEFAHEMTKDGNLTIEFNRKFDSLKAYVNKPYLQQVLINLIKNSSEAFAEKCPNRLIRIETEIVNEVILIHIKDTGKGIPEAQWEQVFDPFHSSKSSGMGMGLPFAKKILLEHRGDINIVNSTPNGTHFQIELPRYEANA
ncbi:sensor histidine kinase [Cytobacillus sp. Hz8]|uniref:sensor histidine kinase n=1 Tax=Cytobacillus sp. Hz8 TaxID=3347168 RepID=UPI0035DFE987